MDQEIEKYLNNLIEDCLQAPAFLTLSDQDKSLFRQKLDDYFSQVILETLIYSLSDDQVKEIENLDFNSPEAAQKIQLLAASVPGFIMILDEVLQKEAEKVKQTGQVPQ